MKQRMHHALPTREANAQQLGFPGSNTAAILLQLLLVMADLHHAFLLCLQQE